MHGVTKLTATSGVLRRPGGSLNSWLIWLQDFSAGFEGGSVPRGREKEEEMYLPCSFLSPIACW